MLPQNYGHLLFNAVRETLETMAFAEVIPCAIKVGDEEFTQAETKPEGVPEGRPEEEPVASPFSGWGDAEGGVDSWGTATPEVTGSDLWETPSASPVAEDSWAPPTTVANTDEDSWNEPPPSPIATDSWGKQVSLPDNDPWGDAATGRVEGMEMTPKEANFDELVENQDDWFWACMKVNSPEIHSIWFIVSRGLAMELAGNMYAGEDFPMDSPLLRDLIAELTNVLGGRLMLLLEEMGGKFTLTVPEIGIGMPHIPDSVSLETVLCKVVVDGEFPVIASICFNQSK